jgi:hypothetical protein
MSSTGTKLTPEKPQATTQPTTQAAGETAVQPVTDHLFEDEAKLEQSNVSFRMITILAVIVAVGAAVAYYFVQQRKDLTPDTASPVVASILRATTPASVTFRTGHVIASIETKPRDPHYKLLEKLAVLTVRDDKKNGIFSQLTPAGEKLITGIDGLKKWKNTDGTTSYTVPLATRELTTVTSVAMAGPNGARVEYTWKWKPNLLGQKFDASGPVIHGFSMWDRASLIKSYGVDFYGDPQKSNLYLVRSDKGWKIGQEE